MADTLTPKERSRNMAAIHNKNTKPEIYFRKLLFSMGYRYRIASNSIPGHPDIFLRKYNTAIFIHGCYWHRHPGCKYAYTPKSHVEFWEKKFAANIRRDAEVQQELEKAGIKQLIVWECTVDRMQRDTEVRNSVMAKVQSYFSSDQMSMEV